MIDTANKRASILGLGLAFRLVLPIPDAALDQGDRQQVAYCYRGIGVSAPIVAPADIITITSNLRRSVHADTTVRRVVKVTVER
jgi:hypothetical protein